MERQIWNLIYPSHQRQFSKLLQFQNGPARKGGFGLLAQLNAKQNVRLLLDTGASGVSVSPEMVKKAQSFIERNLHEKISIEHLSTKFSVGRRNFDRRFIKATGNTPVEYAQRVKVESAKKNFESNRKTINEVMYDVGYSDVKAFREVFRRITGMSPVEYKMKYNREA